MWAELGDPAEEPAGSPVPQPPAAPCLYARSEFFARPLPAEAVGALLEAFGEGRTAGESRELDFMPWGGAYNRRPADATAFVHRDQLFQLKHAVVVAPDAPPASQAAAHRAATRSWASVHPWGSGQVFQNFADPDWSTGPRPTTGPTTPGWSGSRHGMTHRTCSSSRSHSPIPVSGLLFDCWPGVGLRCPIPTR